MAVVEAERPGLSRFILPIAGLIALGLCVGGLLVLLDPQGGPNLLASIYDALGNTSGANELRNGQGDQVVAKIMLAVDRPGGRRRRHLAAVPRRRRAGQPAGAKVARPDPAVGLRRPRPGAAGGLPGLSRGGNDPAQLPGRAGQFTLANFAVLLEPEFTAILRNNVIWLVVGTAGSVLLGLVIAGLFDRVRREALAKTFVFLPLAISLVGASVIWRFVYAWQPAGQPQIGLLNAIVVGFGGEPIPWLTTSPINIFCEIVILVWLQTGFAMVVLSAAIKGVSGEVLEAARLDGATERQLFFRRDRADDQRLDHHGLDDHRHRRPSRSSTSCT